MQRYSGARCIIGSSCVVISCNHWTVRTVRLPRGGIGPELTTYCPHSSCIRFYLMLSRGRLVLRWSSEHAHCAKHCLTGGMRLCLGTLGLGCARTVSSWRTLCNANDAGRCCCVRGTHGVARYSAGDQLLPLHLSSNTRSILIGSVWDWGGPMLHILREYTWYPSFGLI